MPSKFDQRLGQLDVIHDREFGEPVTINGQAIHGIVDDFPADFEGVVVMVKTLEIQNRHIPARGIASGSIVKLENGSRYSLELYEKEATTTTYRLVN